MKKIIVRISKRNLLGLINRSDFTYSSNDEMTYGFIGIDFKKEKNNVAKFYYKKQNDIKSSLKYPGIKIWNNDHKDWKKREVLKSCEDNMNRYIINEIKRSHPKIEFEFVGFDNN